MCLVDNDSVKPRSQACLFPKLAQGSIRLDECLLNDILGCRVIASNQAPGQAPRALTMRCDKQVEALFEFQRLRRGLLYQSLFHHIPFALCLRVVSVITSARSAWAA